MMTTLREELERTLATVPFAEIYGFVLVSIEDDFFTLRIPFRPVLERPGGIIAGHVYMAAADVCMWLAIKAQCGDESSLTSSMITHFLGRGMPFGRVVPRQDRPGGTTVDFQRRRMQ